MIYVRKGKTMGSAEKKLTDDDLSKITGGYIETFGFAKGSDVICPNCRAERKEDFNVTLNFNYSRNDYICKICGQTFSID